MRFSGYVSFYFFPPSKYGNLPYQTHGPLRLILFTHLGSGSPRSQVKGFLHHLLILLAGDWTWDLWHRSTCSTNDLHLISLICLVIHSRALSWVHLPHQISTHNILGHIKLQPPAAVQTLTGSRLACLDGHLDRVGCALWHSCACEWHHRAALPAGPNLAALPPPLPAIEERGSFVRFHYCVFWKIPLVLYCSLPQSIRKARAKKGIFIQYEHPLAT